MITKFRSNCLSENVPIQRRISEARYKGLHWMVKLKQEYPDIHSHREMYYETEE